jgi:RimJ/RimL family protein N-acetyltransferase
MVDAEALAFHANNPNVAKYLTDRFPHPYTRADAEQFIAHALTTDQAMLFAIVYGEEVIGGIGIHFQQDIFRLNAELGYWLGEPYWGKGIMTQAIGLMVEHAFSHTLVERIFARPFGSNLGSQRVLEKSHFVLEARFYGTLIKNQQLEDELVYAIRKGIRHK